MMWGRLAPRWAFRVPRWRFRLGLRWQIALLGTCGVLLVGGIYFAGLRAQEALQRDADTATRLKMLVDEVAQGFLHTYQTDTEFLLRRNEKLIAAHDTMVEGIGTTQTAIEAVLATLPPDDPVQRAGVFRAVLNNYATRYRNMAAAQRTVGFNENAGLEGNLREAVHRIEARLAEFDEPRLTILMLMMRRHEKDFLLRGDEKYGADITKRGGNSSRRWTPRRSGHRSRTN
jgi:methyl-accepting chemotaxis protein